jgi:hypothetical protein
VQGALSALKVSSRPRVEVADIFVQHGEAFRRHHWLSEEQRKAMLSIALCRTAELGGCRYVCSKCDHEVQAYQSCGNRHCPKCQGLAQAKWIEARKERALPTRYFHVVFTLPAELRAVAQLNARIVYDTLFAAASATLAELGHDPGHLGAQLGVTAVLHTWTRELSYHPHLHCIVTAGGLSPDGTRWIKTPYADFLFPVHVMSRVFRGKVLAALDRAHDTGKLRVADRGTPDAWASHRDRLHRKAWCVYAKEPFAGAEHLFEYLGRYTHRVGISNQRLISFDERGVHFATKDGNSIVLAPDEFIRRFLQHVLPKGFVKIRHYGLFAAGNMAIKLVRARELILADAAAAVPIDVLPAPEVDLWRQLVEHLNADEPITCPACNVGILLRIPVRGSRDAIRRRLARPP